MLHTCADAGHPDGHPGLGWDRAASQAALEDKVPEGSKEKQTNSNKHHNNTNSTNLC